MNIQLLDKIEKILKVVVRSIQDQLSFLNTSLTTAQTNITTIQNVSLPNKVDKVGLLNGDGSYVNALTGDFEYGTINGSTTVAYRGVINIGSRLRHYGDTIDPADVVNVQFVNNKIDPVRNLALLAIKRNGDNVSGTNTSQLLYNFSYCTFTFDSHSPVTFNAAVTVNSNFTLSATSNATYSGVITSGTNLVNKNYVDTSITTATTKLFYNGHKEFSQDQGTFYFDPLDTNYAVIQSTNINTFLTFQSQKFVCVTACVLQIRYRFTGGYANHYSAVDSQNTYLTINSVQQYHDFAVLSNDNTNTTVTLPTFIDTIISLNAGDVLQIYTTKQNTNQFGSSYTSNAVSLTIKQI